MTDRPLEGRRAGEGPGIVLGMAGGVALALAVMVVLDTGGHRLAEATRSAALSIDPAAGRPGGPFGWSENPPSPILPAMASLAGGSTVERDGAATPSAAAHDPTEARNSGIGELVLEASESMAGRSAYLDGRSVGELPVVADSISAGWHRVQVRSGSTVIWEAEIPVHRGVVNRVHVMPPAADARCRLTVTARAPSAGMAGEAGGAAVFVDGQRLGATPWEGSLPPGVHSIRVEDPARGRWAEMVSLAAGQSRGIAAELDTMATPRLEIRPAGRPRAGESWAVVGRLDPPGPAGGLQGELCLPRPGGQVVRLPLTMVPGTGGLLVGVVPPEFIVSGTALRCWAEVGTASGKSISDLLQVHVGS